MKKDVAKSVTSLCAACGKKINFFSKISALECSICGQTCHSECLSRVQQVHTFENKGSKSHSIWICSRCMPAYKTETTEGKSCSGCGSYLDDPTNISYCEKCGEIGHESCLRSMAIKIVGRIHLIYPYIHNRNDYNALCGSCHEELIQHCDKIQEADDPIVIRGHSLKGFRVIKEISTIETDVHENEKAVKRQLKNYCLQLGGNAVFEYWYDVNRDRREAGRSDNDNPYYETVMEFKGTGKVVLIEAIKNFRQYTPSHYKLSQVKQADKFRVCFYRDGDFWKVGKLGSDITLKDLNGMNYLHFLLSKPFKNTPCSAIYNLVSKPIIEKTEVDYDSMNTGNVVIHEVIDSKMEEEYKNTVKYLTELINDEDNLDMKLELQEKKKLIQQALKEYSQNQNRGEDPKRATVTKSIRTAIRNIIEAESEIEADFLVGQHLNNYIDTGSSVGYLPPEVEAVEWILYKKER